MKNKEKEFKSANEILKKIKELSTRIKEDIDYQKEFIKQIGGKHEKVCCKQHQCGHSEIQKNSCEN